MGAEGRGWESSGWLQPLLASLARPLERLMAAAALQVPLHCRAAPCVPSPLLSQLLAQHNVSAVFSGHLHSAFGQRLHRLHATPSGGYMAELETAAWKDDRRFRCALTGAVQVVPLLAGRMERGRPWLGATRGAKFGKEPDCMLVTRDLSCALRACCGAAPLRPAAPLPSRLQAGGSGRRCPCLP